MFLGVVREDGGMCPPIFVPKGDTLNAASYIKLTKRVKTWTDSYCGEGQYIFTQDGAMPQMAKITVEWLKSNMPGYKAPELWPPGLIP